MKKDYPLKLQLLTFRLNCETKTEFIKFSNQSHETKIFTDNGNTIFFVDKARNILFLTVFVTIKSVYKIVKINRTVPTETECPCSSSSHPMTPWRGTSSGYLYTFSGKASRLRPVTSQLFPILTFRRNERGRAQEKIENGGNFFVRRASCGATRTSLSRFRVEDNFGALAVRAVEAE